MQTARSLRQTFICPLCNVRRRWYSLELPDLRAVYKSEQRKRWRAPTSNQDLALQHFDTFYGQIYTDSWPSIRTALLSPRKYVGVVNQFADEETTIEHLLQIGRQDIIPKVAEAAQEYLSDLEYATPAADMSSNEHSGLEFEGAVEESVIQQRKTLLSSMSKNLSEDGRANVNEFVPVTEIISELDVGYRVDLKERNPTEMISDQHSEDASDLSGPIKTVYETPEDFNVSAGLKVFALPRGEIHSLGKPRYNPDGHSQFLPLNGASVLPVLALNLKKGDNVLDMCAAPGGKASMMIQTLLPSKIVCVDNSSRRLDRLRSVVTTMGPTDILDSGLISIAHCDGRMFNPGMEFDKVIVDVPCTGDRYALTSPEMNIFSNSRADERRGLPNRQTSLLLRTLGMCRVGGEVVYTTCTLSPAQNEAVVRAAITTISEMSNGKIRYAFVDLGHLRHAFQDRYFRFDDSPQAGLTVIPFLPNNYGPAYVCKIRRIE